MLGLVVMIVLTSLAFNTMISCDGGIEDPLVPASHVGILKYIAIFPSGAIYPIQAFSAVVAGYRQERSFYLRVMASMVLLLKETTLAAVWGRHAVSLNLRSR